MNADYVNAAEAAQRRSEPDQVPSRESEPRLKTAAEITRMRVAARRLASVLQTLARTVRPGLTTAELAVAAYASLTDADLHPVQRGYRGFPADVAISVNEIAAHGVPGRRILQTGDVVTVDLAVDYCGWKADAAWTYSVGDGTPAGLRLLRAAYEATRAGIAAARAGARLGDIGVAVECAAQERGCRVVSSLCGHGIGRYLHEPPRVMQVSSPFNEKRIVPGMVLSIEPVVVLDMADVSVVRSADTHGLQTSDGRPCAQFEHTVAVFADHSEVLTVPVPVPRRRR